MTKLFDKQPDETTLALYQTANKKFADALRGNANQFIFNIDHYLVACDEGKTLDRLGNEGISSVTRIAQKFGWTQQDKVIGSNTYLYYAIFRLLEKYVHVGIDMERSGYPTSLYTRSLEVLDELARAGCLDASQDTVANIQRGLCENKARNAVAQGKYTVVRLDITGFRNGKAVFVPVIPQSALDIGGGKRFVFVPVPLMYAATEALKVLTAGKALEFHYATVKGSKVVRATMSPAIVKSVYQNSDEDLVESKLNKITPGYDVLRQTFRLYDIEASLHALGVASFRPEMLDKVTTLSPSMVNRSLHHINFNVLRAIYRTRIRQANSSLIDNNSVLNVSSYSVLKDKQEALIDLGESKTGKDLYFIMKANPEIFGTDLDEALEKRERMMPKFVKKFERVELPQSSQERLTMLSNMMKVGVCKVTVQTKEGKMMEVFASNSRTVLARMLGKDYIKVYESTRYKLLFLKDLIKGEKLSGYRSLEKTAVELNLLDYLEKDLFFSEEKHTQLRAVDNALQMLEARSTYRNVFPEVITYRNIYARSSKNFYGALNVSTIMSLEFAGV